MSNACNAFSASRIELRLTPSASTSSVSVGSGSPELSPRLRINPVISSRIALFILVVTRFIGAGVCCSVTEPPNGPTLEEAGLCQMASHGGAFRVVQRDHRRARRAASDDAAGHQ